ncbi:Na+/H+ antiporter subunit E [Egicoccus sp. AB-alg2]|uniref:Na+/H+ antiporter subunit E n=1 Tax=Egicoccus sp. AB-alg2 TaxID=3242693 RepID=UPI00359F0026
MSERSRGLPRRVLGLVRRLPFIVWALLVFLWALLVSNVRVAWEVLTPGFGMTPAIVRVPTSTRTDWETTLLANMITMTPGTLSIEIDEDTRDLYVHTLYYEGREAFLADIASLERTLLKATR